MSSPTPAANTGASPSTPSVALIGVGAMGAALGEVLVKHGVPVRTDLSERSPASQSRARAAGLVPVDTAGLLDADIILSVIPPSLALDTAARMAALWQARRGDAGTAPLYVDCNAISPETALQVGALIQDAGLGYVDASIIGAPPRAGRPAPRLYASGPLAGRFSVLSRHGLDIRAMQAPLGTASTLKMCYAGITKGLAALAASSIMAADREGIADELAAELAASQPSLYQGFLSAIPSMLPKAYRWVGEMEEIAAFLGEDRPESGMYQHMARFYAAIAAAQAGYEPTTFDHFLQSGGDKG